MADPFAMALGALFGGPCAVAAVYTAAGQAPLPIRVVRLSAAEDLQLPGGMAVIDTNLVSVQRSDVERPEKGDSLAIGPERFTIDGKPRLDIEGVSWLVELIEV